jgi:AraC-like DNA-binding protein
MTASPHDELTLPAVHALHLAEVVRRAGTDASRLFAELALSEDALAKPGARLSLPQVEALVARARALTGDDAIGIQLGMQMRVSAHGYLGFAAMTSPTVRDALDLAQRFVPTRTNAIALAVHVRGDRASLVIEERGDFGTARDAVLFALAIGIWQIGIALTGRMLEGSAELAFPRPSYFDRYELFAPKTRFSQPANQLVFDASVLDLPLSMADRASQQLAVEQCERSLEALGLDGDVLDRARRLALKDEGGARSLDEVATALALSPRTLKRKLATHGVTYSDLLDEQRLEAALLLLRAEGGSIDDVAERLGYSDTANFGRAFRRWTGISPAAYRRGDAATTPTKPAPTSGRRRSPG